MTPLTFENYPNAPYPIPIIDTRSLKQYDSLKLSKSYEKIYDNICSAIAHKIAQDLKLSTEYYLEITSYIKKINLFQKIEVNNFDHIPLVLEVNHRFYSYNLAPEDLQRITYSHLPILDLKRVISENPNYHFILLSNYTRLSRVKNDLQQEFDNNLFIPEVSTNNFPDIWQQKIDNNFALFGQHLDRISFFVRRAGENIEICLPEQVCYEGEQEAIVYGQYEKDNHIKQNFSLKTKSVTLPFRINNEQFINSETDTEQIYKIENQYFDETPELDVKIRFRIKPSLAPKLEILDNHERILHSKLIDHKELVIKASDTLGFLSTQEIFAFRINKSQKFINVLKNQAIQIPADLLKLTNRINQSIANTTNNNNIHSLRAATQSFLDLIVEYSKKENNSNNGLEVYVIDSQDHHKSLKAFIRNYENIDKRLNEFLKTIKQFPISIDYNKSKDYRKIYNNILQIFGKSFAFSKSLDLDFLYDVNQIYYQNLSTDDHIHSIHLHNIARMSCTDKRRGAFFNLFNIRSQYHKKEFYKVDEYIWGYARILLWYLNFENHCLSQEMFKQHFTTIISHCLTLNISSNREYLKDALITLIYLLTFREIDPQFVRQRSQSYNQAKRLCLKLKGSRIKSKKANLEMPLNQLLEQLLDGSATQEEVNNVFEID